jgi:chitin synthase
MRNVLDLDLLEWLDPTQLDYPSTFDDLRNGSLNQEVQGTDVTHLFSRLDDRQLGNCLVEIIKVGTVDSTTVGCVASKVVLYISLVFIIGLVLVKFFMALWFHWFLSWRIGSHNASAMKSRKRQNEIEEWSDDIYRQAPNLPTIRPPPAERPRSSFFPNTSRFTPKANQVDGDRPATAYRTRERRGRHPPNRPGSSANLLSTHSIYGESAQTQSGFFDETPRFSTFMPDEEFEAGPSGFIHESVVPQPPPEYQPFGFPLVHVLCLVTTYNESMAGLRTTFDSIATSEYPNSHKLLLVLCDGNVKGAGESQSTPDYVVSMMKDLAVPADEVRPFSYVAIATGYKRHNMARVYAGFYDYDDATVPLDKQQRVPMICIAKCGTPQEAKDRKPGNRGKRDSQIILMSFLQKVLFDERMTELEFEIFNGIWKITGLSPDAFDMVLMVDTNSEIRLIIRLMRIQRFSLIR